MSAAKRGLTAEQRLADVRRGRARVRRERMERELSGNGWRVARELVPELFVRAGELDVAVMALPVPGVDLAHSTLANDPFLLAVGSDHPLASVSEVTPSQLSELAVLLLDEGHCLRDQALAVCSAAGTASTSVAATSLSTLVQMVAAGQGVTLLPAIAATVEAHRGGRVAIVPLTDAPQRTLALVWRSSSPRSGLYRDLAGLLAPLFQSCAGT